MLTKSITDIEYEDIIKLKDKKIEESSILDYKVDMPQDKDLVKHVCAFANTHGGHIVIGVEESGNGGYPTEIKGVQNIDKEKIEHIILSNVTPRLNIGIKKIIIPDSNDKAILVIHIPDSHTRPYYDNKNHRFYKRFNFKSEPMIEQEIADAYKDYSANNNLVDLYINKIKDHNKDGIIGNIIVIPSNIQHRLINTCDYRKYENMDEYDTQSLDEDLKRILPSRLIPYLHGLISRPTDQKFKDIIYTSIHRNGCIHYVGRFHQQARIIMGHKQGSDKYDRFIAYRLAVRLMQTIKFASSVLSHHDYYGKVRIDVSFEASAKTLLINSPSLKILDPNGPLGQLGSHIGREHSLDYIKHNYQQVAASIMHEIVNGYSQPRCVFFDENDNWVDQQY